MSDNSRKISSQLTRRLAGRMPNPDVPLSTPLSAPPPPPRLLAVKELWEV